MWKNPNDTATLPPPPRPAAPPIPSPTPQPAAATFTSTPTPAPQRSPERPTHISKNLVLKGTIHGNEDLFLDGKMEGSIEVPDAVVTIGLNGQVQANVSAREVVIMGRLNGNVSASDRVEIKAQGALTGDVSAARISIEDGAFFKGGIDIRKAARGAGAE